MIYLDSLDPWMILAAGLFVLLIIEARFGHSDWYNRGKVDGYDMAARHHRIATADEEVPAAFLKAVD